MSASPHAPDQPEDQAGHLPRHRYAHRDTPPRSARREAVRRVQSSTLSDKRALTQTQLLDAGRRLFTDKGIGSTSVGDICSLAGYTRGAFYSNFTDMDHFVRRLAEEQWTALSIHIRQAVDANLPATFASALDNESEVEAALSHLASKILHAMPVSREFFLLQNELISYIVRAGERSAPVRQAYKEFKTSLRRVLVDGLEAIGRECLLSAEDTTELLFAAAERSMRVGLLYTPRGHVLEGDSEEAALTAQLDRTLPTLLTHLSRPAAAA